MMERPMIDEQLRRERLEMAEAMDAVGFTEMVAGWPKDGEPDGDGTVYEQTIDNAFETLAALINKARTLTREDAPARALLVKSPETCPNGHADVFTHRVSGRPTLEHRYCKSCSYTVVVPRRY